LTIGLGGRDLTPATGCIFSKGRSMPACGTAAPSDEQPPLDRRGQPHNVIDQDLHGQLIDLGRRFLAFRRPEIRLRRLRVE
jgi:hypothetical protein